MDNTNFHSTTIAFTTPEGLEGSVTLRLPTIDEIVNQSNLLSRRLRDLGNLPKSPRGATQNPQKQANYGPRGPNYVEGRICAQCGGKLVHTKRKDGTPYIKCENNKWNSQTRQSEGCSFVEWPKRKQDDAPPWETLDDVKNNNY